MEVQQLTSSNNPEVNPFPSTSSRRTRKRSRTVLNFPHHLVQPNPRNLSTQRTRPVDLRIRTLNPSHRGKQVMDLLPPRLRQHQWRRCILVGKRRGKLRKRSKLLNLKERRSLSISSSFLRIQSNDFFWHSVCLGLL